MATKVEHQPLLAPEPESASSRESAAVNTSTDQNLPRKNAWRQQLRFYILIFALQFITNFGFYLSDLPIVRLFERKLCQLHYDSTAEFAEASCKLPVIQNRLAFILELMNAFNAVPGENHWFKDNICSNTLHRTSSIPVVRNSGRSVW